MKIKNKVQGLCLVMVDTILMGVACCGAASKDSTQVHQNHLNQPSNFIKKEYFP